MDDERCVALPPLSLQLAARKTADVREATEASQLLVNLPADGKVHERAKLRSAKPGRVHRTIHLTYGIVTNNTLLYSKERLTMMANEPAASFCK